MTEKLSPVQLQRLASLEQYRKVVEHVKKLVLELESNRAAKTAVIQGICGTIARELSQLRIKAMIENFGAVADPAGAMSVMAGRGAGLNFKIRALSEGLASLEKLLDQIEKAERAPRPSGAQPRPA